MLARADFGPGHCRRSARTHLRLARLSGTRAQGLANAADEPRRGDWAWQKAAPAACRPKGAANANAAPRRDLATMAPLSLRRLLTPAVGTASARTPYGMLCAGPKGGCRAKARHAKAILQGHARAVGVPGRSRDHALRSDPLCDRRPALPSRLRSAAIAVPSRLWLAPRAAPGAGRSPFFGYGLGPRATILRGSKSAKAAGELRQSVPIS